MSQTEAYRTLGLNPETMMRMEIISSIEGFPLSRLLDTALTDYIWLCEQNRKRKLGFPLDTE